TSSACGFCARNTYLILCSRFPTPRASLGAVDDLLRVPDRGLVRCFVFLQDVDRLLRGSGSFFLVTQLALDLRLLVVHEVGVRVLLERLVYPLRRLVHILI